jgi:hypothetical protein
MGTKFPKEVWQANYILTKAVEKGRNIRQPKKNLSERKTLLPVSCR